MSLLFHELTHIFASLFIGYFIWRKSKSFILSFFAALIGGVLVDLDHFVDYFIAYGASFDLNSFLKGYQFLQNDKIIVPLHAWEWIPALLLSYALLKKHYKKHQFKLAKYILTFLLAFTLGLASHLAIDTFTNELILPGYSIIYRIKNNFAVEKLVKKDHYRIHVLEKKKLFP